VIHISVLSSPGFVVAESGSHAVFRWTFSRDVTDAEIWFESRKNPLLLATLTAAVDGHVIYSNSAADFRKRVELVVENNRTLIFRIRNVTQRKMGVYAVSLHREKLYNSNAFLFTSGKHVKKPTKYDGSCSTVHDQDKNLMYTLNIGQQSLKRSVGSLMWVNGGERFSGICNPQSK